MQQWRILLYVFHLHASVLISDKSVYSTHTHTHICSVWTDGPLCFHIPATSQCTQITWARCNAAHNTLSCSWHMWKHTHTKTHRVIATVIFVTVQRGPDSIWAAGCVRSGSENRSIHPKSLNHSAKNLWSAKMFLTETEQERKCEYLHYEIALAVPRS